MEHGPGGDGEGAPGVPTDDGPPVGGPTEGVPRGGAPTVHPSVTRSLWAHVVLLGVVLFALLALVRPQAIVVPDEGVYLAQADALAHGGWEIPREATDVDVRGELSRLLPEAVLGDNEVAYARHAAYPLLIAPALHLGGYTGVLVISVLGLWGAAIASSLIARRMDPALAIPALWLVGIASPLVFYGYLSVAHAAAAATTGFASLGISRWVDLRSVVGLVGGTLALAATVLLRSEGTLFALGLSIALVLLSLRQLRTRGIDVRAMLTGVFLGAVTVASYLADTRVDHMVTRGDTYGLNPAAIATRSSADPVSGSWASLLRPFGRSPESATIWVVTAAASLIAASLVMRVAPRRWRVALGLLVVAAAASVAMLFDPPGLVTGLLPAFPMLAAGLVWLHRSDLEDPMRARIITTVAITAAGIVATLYANGGAAEWGGRFFGLLVPLTVPLAVLGLSRVAALMDRTQRRVAFACSVCVVFALSSSALRLQADLRSDTADTVQGTISYLEDHFGGDPPLVVVANERPGGNSRRFWDVPEGVEVLTTLALERLDAAIEPARAAGVERIVVVTDVDPADFEDQVGTILDENGWAVLESSSTPQGGAELVLIGEPSAASSG